MSKIDYGKLREISDRLPVWNRDTRNIEKRGLSISRFGIDDRGFVLGGRILQEASIIAGAIYERGNRNRQEAQKTAHEISEAIERYAILHEFVIDDTFLEDVIDETKTKDVGASEGIVFFRKSALRVTKVIKHISHWLTEGLNGELVVDWLKYFDYIAVNNSVCPDVVIEIKGFCRDSGGDLCLVVEHDFIRGAEFDNYYDERGVLQYSTESLAQLMIKMYERFKARPSDTSGYEFQNERYVFGDTNPYNVLVDEEDVIHLFDVWVELKDRSCLKTSLINDDGRQSKYNVLDVITEQQVIRH